MPNLGSYHVIVYTRGEPSLLVLDYLGKWRLRGSETPPAKGTTESSPVF